MTELSTDQLRDLAARVREQLPEGLFYGLLIWPPGLPADVGYFSNAHRDQAVVALQTLLEEALKR